MNTIYEGDTVLVDKGFHQGWNDFKLIDLNRMIFYQKNHMI